MKRVKSDFKDILFYAQNWSDAKGASYGHFAEFLSPNLLDGQKVPTNCGHQGNKNEKIATVICGHFNICFKTNRNNRVTKFIETKGFQQLMQEPTHIKGRNIDHFYFRSGGQIQEDAHIYRYSPYYTDHDAICATIKWKGLIPLWGKDVYFDYLK